MQSYCSHFVSFDAFWQGMVVMTAVPSPDTTSMMLIDTGDVLYIGIFQMIKPGNPYFN